MKTKEYWNYSTDHQPRHKYNMSGQYYPSRAAAERAAKSWCRSEGLKFDAEMVGEVSDLIARAEGRAA